MLFELEERLREHRITLDALAPQSAAVTQSFDYVLMQTYILGFQEAAQIAAKAINKEQGTS